MTLNSSALFSYGVVSLTGRMSTSEPGQECADAVDHHGEAALHLAGDQAGDDGALLHRGFEVVPRLEALGLVARQLGFAVAVFERFDRDGDEIAGLDFDFALVVLEFLDRDEAFGLEAGVDDDDVVVDADDFGGDEFALAHFLAREAFLEQRGEVFDLHRGGHAGGGGSHGGLVPHHDQPPAARTLFLARRAGCRIPSEKRRLKRGAGNSLRVDGPLLPSSRFCLSPACASGRSPHRRPVPLEHQADRAVDRHPRRIQDHGVGAPA